MPLRNKWFMSNNEYTSSIHETIHTRKEDTSTTVAILNIWRCEDWLRMRHLPINSETAQCYVRSNFSRKNIFEFKKKVEIDEKINIQGKNAHPHNSTQKVWQTFLGCRESERVLDCVRICKKFERKTPEILLSPQSTVCLSPLKAIVVVHCLSGTKWKVYLFVKQAQKGFHRRSPVFYELYHRDADPQMSNH